VFSCRGTKSRGVFPCHGSLLSKDVRLLVFRAFYLKSCRLSCGWLRDFLLDVSRGLQNRLVVCKIVLSCGIKPRYGFRVIVCAFKDARFSDVLSYVLLAAALGWPFFAGTFSCGLQIRAGGCSVLLSRSVLLIWRSVTCLVLDKTLLFLFGDYIWHCK